MTVSISSPANNAVLSGNVYLGATVTQAADYVVFNIDNIDRITSGWRNSDGTFSAH